MSPVRSWLGDRSFFAWVARSPDFGLWEERLVRGLVRVVPVTLLEAGYSARSGAEHHQIVSGPPFAWCPIEYVSPAAEDRAVEVQALLAGQGHHRAPSPAALLVAAVGELAGLTVLHVDKGFELIAQVTGQLLERLTVP